MHELALCMELALCTELVAGLVDAQVEPSSAPTVERPKLSDHGERFSQRGGERLKNAAVIGD